MTRWKWDVDPNDPLAQAGVPVTSKWPNWGYLVAFDKASPQRPTQAETRLLLSYTAARKVEWQFLIDSHGLDKDPFAWYPGVDTTIFHKYDTNDWAYRRREWYQDRLSPSRTQRGRKPLTLLQLMDWIRITPLGNPDPAWAEWKQQHPEVFGDG